MHDEKTSAQMGVGGEQWIPDGGGCDLSVQRRIKEGTDERIVVKS